MPKVFVAGPSVRPDFGTPDQFIKGLQDTVEGFSRRRIMDERTENNRLFNQQTADLNTRKQDFVEAEPERAELLRMEGLARDNERASIVRNGAEGLQYAGGTRFDTLDSDLMKDPRYAELDEAGKLAARNNFILNNPSAMTDPRTFAEQLKGHLMQSGKFSEAQMDAAVAKEVNARYPTADKDIIKSLLSKPDFKVGGNTVVDSNGNVVRGQGSVSLVADPTNPTDRGTVVDRITDTFGLDKNPDTLPIFGNRLDIGNLNATKQDVAQGVGFLSQNDVNSPTAQEAAFNIAFNPDRTVKEKYNWTTANGRKNLLEAARKAQGTEERLFNKKGGALSRVGATGQGQSATDVAQAAAAYNDKLLSRLTPRALSDSGLVTAFLDNLGPAQNNTRQGGSGDGGQVPPVASVPEAVVQPAPAPAVAQENRLTDAQRLVQALSQGGPEEAPVPGLNAPAAPDDKLFNIGGPAQEQVALDRIIDLNKGLIPQIIDGAPQAKEDLSKLISSFTPPGAGVLASQPAPVQPSTNTPPPSKVQEETDTDNPVGTGNVRDRVAENEAFELVAKGTIVPEDMSLEKVMEAYREYLEGQ